MKKEFNLSERKLLISESEDLHGYFYPEEDVKEKIQNAQWRLKAEAWLKQDNSFWVREEEIDKIFLEEFGDKLI